MDASKYKVYQASISDILFEVEDEIEKAGHDAQPDMEVIKQLCRMRDGLETAYFASRYMNFLTSKK